MKNNTLLEISEKLSEAKDILLFPHMRVDGDALGSCMALCMALRKLGKRASILVEDEIPENLKFLVDVECMENIEGPGRPEICVAIDCSDPQRFEKRKDIFYSGECKICIDHHATTVFFADLNYIDAKAAATGEIIYCLLCAMKAEMDGKIANALYAAIATDTGNFCYSNTTKKTHEIVASLYDFGLDHSFVFNEIYDNVSREQMEIHTLALSSLKTFAHGKAVLTWVTQDMLDKTGAAMSETEGIVEKLRSIRGVEISVLLKEEEKGTIKVSLRAKTTGDVAAVARLFGGGGHKKAAGCTIRKPLFEAKKEIMNAVEKQLGE